MLTFLQSNCEILSMLITLKNYDKVFYVMGKALSGELFCTRTGLVSISGLKCPNNRYYKCNCKWSVMFYFKPDDIHALCLFAMLTLQH